MAEVCELLHAHTKYELAARPPLSQPSIKRPTAGKENAGASLAPASGEERERGRERCGYKGQGAGSC